MFGTNQPRTQTCIQAWWRPATGEFRAGPQLDDNAGEGLIEFGVRDVPATYGRIIEVESMLVVTIDNEEVIEVPEDDCRQVRAMQRFGLSLACLRFESVLTRRLREVNRVGAIT